MEEKKQFEDWQLRLKKERDELIKEARKLKQFIDNPESKASWKEWELLRRQMCAMREYICALTERCKFYGLIECEDLEPFYY